MKQVSLFFCYLQYSSKYIVIMGMVDHAARERRG